MLDDLDRELWERGHRFVRYADDLRVFVRSERAAQRVFESVCGVIEQRLKLKVNREKSSIRHAAQATLLGFGFLLTGPQVTIRVGPKAVKRLKDRLRILTRRSWRVSMEYRIGRLNRFTTGSLGVPGLLHDVAVKRFTESFCSTSAMCGARCRRCSEACQRRTCNMSNTLDHRRRRTYPAPTCTFRRVAHYARFAPREKVGWMAYFRLADAEPVFRSLDGWLRRRLRQVRWKEWKTTAAKRHNLRIRGISESNARKWGGSSKGYWRVAGSKILQVSLPNSYWDRLGLKTLSQTWQRLNRTA